MGVIFFLRQLMQIKEVEEEFKFELAGFVMGTLSKVAQDLDDLVKESLPDPLSQKQAKVSALKSLTAGFWSMAGGPGPD
jgi:hypothetical protein